ncbi:MAG TPA: stage II sporulation protein M [Planctomycetota bacterium]|nr:stage II sporulation protein M [Planctomycetota bacterium]
MRGGPGGLRSTQFRKEREGAWRELERLVERAEKSGVRSLPAQQLARLPLLYRATLSSLSVARAISLDRNLVEYLESLCARAYFCVYGTTRSLGNAVSGFFGERFPAAVRRYGWHMAMAGLFLVLGTLVGHVLVARDPDWYYVFVDEGLAGGRDPAATTEFLRNGLYDGEGRSTARLGAFASFLFTHNARVGMFAFALGFVAGIPVYLLLFSTGLMLGAFSALYASRGLGVALWGWLLPHGITELLAVVLCGGAGLIVAQALVFPGRHTRLRNLAIRGREAGVVVLGAIAMLLVAGLIEGIFRQLVTSDTARYLVAQATLVFWAFYFLRVGREARP